jgi:hypothetical protein
MLSSNMKNEQQVTQKLTSKGRGKNRAFYAFTHKRLFSIVSNFFVKLFAIFSKVLHSV